MTVGRRAALLLALSLAAACATPAPPGSTDAVGGGAGSPRRPVALGVVTDPTEPLAAEVEATQEELGARVDVVGRFLAWSVRGAPLAAVLADLRVQSAAGRTVLLTWEPGDGSHLSDPFPLADIAAGRTDPYVDSVLAVLATMPGPVALRFGHEMNGDWYPWAGDATSYVAAWGHLRARQRALAPAVSMVWSVNSEDVPRGNEMEAYFPGVDAVDVVAVDGYNCLPGWSGPDELLGSAYRRVTALHPTAPVWLTEVATCEAEPSVVGSAGRSKAEWVTALFALPDVPRLTTVVWFDRDKERDWRIASSPASLAAFRAALSDRSRAGR